MEGVSPHIHLALVFHQHQPVGNYDFVFEELFQKSYDPLLASLERHPGVKVALHYSGPLLDWLVAKQPGYIQRIRTLVGRGQVELLGGGYYEPALPAISEPDRIGQLRKLRTKVMELFGEAPTGAWVAERVWEPELPTSLAAAEYTWTILDDVHFGGTGLVPEELHGWYLTEAQGETVGVFASSTRLRYLVPWGSVDDCVNFLRDAGDRHPGSLIAMGDDGEKFGGWPTTYLHCWENGWVDRFFARLEAEAHWLATTHPGTWRREHPPEGLVYLPSASYMEMGEWSLPPKQQQQFERAREILGNYGGSGFELFLRGGHWRNFLVRYPEVNLLHKRASILSREAHRQQNDAALEHVWQAQCNCPFWHGVFGGVYLEHIRHANFGHLAAADALLTPGAAPPEIRDWDADGQPEVCLRSPQQLVIVDPADGGEILHWDLRKQAWHLTHAVARRPEAYHEGLKAGASGEVHSIHDAVRVKDDEALATTFLYDHGLRVAAQDTVLAAVATRSDYARARQADVPRAETWEATGPALSMAMVAGPARYAKVIAVAGGLTVEYGLPGPDWRLFSEWNLSLPSPAGEPPLFECTPDTVTVSAGAIRLSAGHDAAEAWVEQLFSVSNTEGGVELAPQGWSIVFGGRPGAPMTIRWEVVS